MCYFCTEFGSKKAHHADANKGINMNITNRIWHLDLCLLTKPDKTKCACHSNRQATSRRGRDCFLHHDATAIQKRDCQTTAANAKDRGCHTNTATCRKLYRG